MAEWLIVQLPRATEAPVSWLLADSQGQPLSAPQTGSLTQCATETAGRRVGVLVPSAEVLATEVELPQRSGVRPQQLVPYALEEQLAADVETLHFAVGARAANGRTPVAIVTRSLMQEWLAQLNAAGLTPAVLCAASALLPERSAHVTVLLDEDTLAVRRAGQPAAALPADDIAASLEAALGADMAAEHLIFYASAADWHARSAEVEALRTRCESLQVQLLSSGALPLLAPQLPGGRYINLLSGEFAAKAVFQTDWRRWRLAAALAGVLIVVHLGGLSLLRWQQTRSEHGLDQAITAVAHGMVPAGIPAGDVRRIVEQRLLAARGAQQGNGLMSALAALSHSFTGLNGVALEALSFRNGSLDLQLMAPDAETLGRISRTLRQSGWQAQIISGRTVGSGYEGHVQMRPPGAPAPATNS